MDNHFEEDNTIDDKGDGDFVGEDVDEEDTTDDDDGANDDDGDGGSPSFEKVLEHLGMPGKYQLKQLVFVNVTAWVIGFIALSIVFMGYIPNHECRKVNETELLNNYALDFTGNVTSAHVSYESCDIKITLTSNQSISDADDKPRETIHSLSCPNGRDFYDAKDTTYASEWDLVCESKGQVEFSQTVFTIGQFVGGLGSSPLSDKFGRKVVFVVSTCACCLVDIAHIFSPTIYIVYIIKFFSGLAVQASITSSYIFGIELVAPRHRQITSTLFYVSWVLNVLIVGGVAYFVQDLSWRYFHGSGIAVGLLAFLSPFILTESPRWLAVNGRHEEALEILKYACKQNGKDFEILKQKFDAFISYNKYSSRNPSAVPMIRVYDKKTQRDSGVSNHEDIISPTDIITRDNDNDINVDKNSNTHVPSPFALLCHRRLLSLLAVGTYLWLTIILTYYGLYITSSVLAGNRFLNFIIMSLVELPSLALSLYMLNKIGRRIVFGIFTGMTVVCFAISTLMSTVCSELPGSDTVVTVMFILGKFSITASFAALYLLTPELFPTNVRTTAHGFCSALGRVGSMVAPFLRLLHAEVKWGPAVLFTVMSLLACVVCLYLPETKDKDLPNTLEDILVQRRSSKTAAVTNSGKEKVASVVV